MSRILIVFLVVYLILTLIGCLDEFTTLRGEPAARSASATRAAKPSLPVATILSKNLLPTAPSFRRAP